MSEFRKDPVSARWVIVAPERAARPTDFPVERRYGVGGFCPFCEGHEDKTPPEVAAWRREDSQPNAPGWRVRVVPNRFPALQRDAALEKFSDGLCRRMTGFGVHEIIVESPRHILSINDLEDSGVADVMRAYQERIRNAQANPQIRYVMVFKNVGAAAGATVEHSHSQLIGMPVVPATVRNEIRNARRFAETSGGCIFCRMIEDELGARNRVVFESADYVSLAPFASRFPFETWILPRKHEPHIERQPSATLGGLATALRSVLDRLDLALSSPAYNYLIHTSPTGAGASKHYHWHIEIIPTVTRIAGFEWGTGSYINPVLPESAAAFLREAVKRDRPKKG